jgi:hypothetical protein
MMTDWIVSMFYLAFFGLLTDTVTNFIAGRFRSDRDGLTELAATSPADPNVASLATVMKLSFATLVVGFGMFAVAGCIRLASINFGIVERGNIARLHLSTGDRAEIIRRLRQAKPAAKAFLPDPAERNLLFIDTQERFKSGLVLPDVSERGRHSKARPMKKSGVGSPLVVFQDRVPPFLYYFPAQTEFEERSRLFKRRSYGCTTLLTSLGRVLFPGKIPGHLKEKNVVYVGWVEGAHPDGTRYGEVMHCIAIIPVLNETATLDYAHAVLVKPRAGLL